jgi:hypothetical protein
MMSMSTSMMSNSAGATGAMTAPPAVQPQTQAQTPPSAPAANQPIKKDTVTLSAEAVQLAGGK